MTSRALIASLAVLASASTGCSATTPIPRYAEPIPSEPHAAVSVKIAHASRPGADLEAMIFIDGRRVAQTPLGESTIPARVRPGDTRWSFYSDFSHQISVTTLEEVPHYETSYDPCAGYDSRGDCVSATRYRTVYRLEPVTRVHKIADARCDAEGRYSLAAGRNYRIDYAFIEGNKCHVVCRDVTDSEETGCNAVVEPESAATTNLKATSSSLPATHDDRPLHKVGVGAAAAGGVALALAGGAILLAGLKDVQVDACNRGQRCEVDPAAAARDRDVAIDVAAVSGVVGAALTATGIGLIVFGPSQSSVTARVGAANGMPGMTFGGAF